MRTSFSTIAFNVADANNGAAVIVQPVTTPALGDTAKPSEAKSNIAAPKRTARKLSGNAVAKPSKPAADKPSKPVAAEPAAKPVADIHAYGTSYNGASPPIRTHGKLLSPIVLDRIPNSYTARDAALATALYKQHGTKHFQRLNIDAGALSRLIGHRIVAHVSGNLDQRDAKFVVTAHAVKTRFSTAAAPKA